jgi:hypothetical protein
VGVVSNVPLFLTTFLIQLYRPVEETPCHFVSSLDELVELNEKLLSCKEFAVDLEVSWLFVLFWGHNTGV